jgi:hypothetical protein
LLEARMAATVSSISRPTRLRSDSFSGAVLTAGAVTLFVGTLFYARLTPRVGLPALAAERGQALADAIALGADKMAMAGGWAFFGDWLLLGACIALLGRGRGVASNLGAIGWALLAVSAAIAMIFDSMMSALLWSLAHDSDPQPFIAFKAWFDLLFSVGNIPFGLGCVAVLWADARSNPPLLPKPFSYFGIAIGALAAVSGVGWVTGLLHLPLVIGLTVTFGCVVLAALGIQIARADSGVAADVGS